MARKDVDLVIRAKDEAAKVVDQITKALNDFYIGTQKLDKGAEDSENALTSLGGALGKLDKVLKNATGAEKMSASLDKASSALSKLEGKMAETEQAARGQSRELERASSQTDRYASKLEGASAAADRQKRAVAETRKEQKALTAAHEKAGATVESLKAKQAALPAQIAKQSAALEKAEARYRDLSTAMEATVSPGKALQTQFDASTRSVAQKSSRLTTLRTELDKVQSELRAAESAVALFTGEVAQATQKLTQQEVALGKIEENYGTLKAQVRASSGVQKTLQRDVDKTSASLARQQSEIEQAEKEYVELAQSVGKADAALSTFADSSVADLTRAMTAQKKSTLEAKREWSLAETNVKELAASIRATKNPTEQLTTAFDNARTRAGAAKAEYQANRQALMEMGQAHANAGRSVDSITAATTRFQTAGARLNAQLGQINTGVTRTTSRINSADTAAQRHTTTMGRLASAYREFYGDSRRSLSLLQRIRGEVLSLVAAYGGLYAAIEIIRGAVTATETLAGVTSRLTVAFGDAARAGQELDFIRRQADRLGVSFTNLATEYSKFAVATKGTNLEGQATRRIFIGIAEAARVNRASQQELQGVFTALTQIVSKGAVQMEELRQQLGDRLPGAIQLMADALGVGTDELIKMMEQGQVTADALIPFADAVRDRFGPGLEGALDSTAAKIGRLQNAAYQMLLLFSDSGFMEGFRGFLDTLTELLQSADFEAFVARAGAAMGQFFDFLSFGAENFQLLIAAAAAFLGLRLAPLVIAVASGFKDLGAGVLASARAMRTGTASAGAMTGAVTGLRAAITALLSSTGIGLLVAAIGAGVALWATNADTATEALNTHEKIVDQVKDAYDELGGSTDDWAATITGVTIQQAIANVGRLRDELATARREAITYPLAIQNMFEATVGGTEASRRSLRDLVNDFRDGKLTVEDYKNALEALALADTSLDQDLIVTLQDGADAVRGLETAASEADAVVVALNENASEGAREAAAATLDLVEATGDVEDAARDATAQQEQFNAAMTELRDRIPEVKRELDYLEESNAIESFLQQSIQAATTWAQIQEAIGLSGAAMRNLNVEFAQNIPGFVGAGDGVEAAAALLRDAEGFRSTPYYDENAFRVGFGSDTITLADGSVQQVVEGMRVSVADANRDLIRRITEEFMPRARNAVGSSNFDALTPQQQAALTSITYNYGSLPGTVADAIRSGMSDSGIAQVIRNLGAGGKTGEVGDALTARRNREAGIFESGAGVSGAIQAQERAAEAARREAERADEERQRDREATESRILNTQFEIDQQERINAGKEREAAIEAAIRAAQEENPAITEAELAAVREQAGNLFELQQVEEARKDAKEAHVLAEERVTQLTQHRAALERQLEIARENGDTESTGRLKSELDEINTALLAAIDNAIRMWDAVGGPKAALAMAQLQAARLEAVSFGDQAQRNYVEWDRVSDMLVNGLSGAFDTFARAVSEGENGWVAARNAFLQFASDFLIQIGQMIVKQMILNALKAAFGGTPFGSLIGVGTGHTGGVVGSARVGSGNYAKSVDPVVFSGAQKYHTGGIVGLAPDEVPIIAKKGEEMLTEDDPRHRLNGGRSNNPDGAMGKMSVRIVNALDSSTIVQEGLNTRTGEETIMNFIRANAAAIRSELDG